MASPRESLSSRLFFAEPRTSGSTSGARDRILSKPPIRVYVKRGSLIFGRIHGIYHGQFSAKRDVIRGVPLGGNKCIRARKLCHRCASSDLSQSRIALRDPRRVIEPGFRTRLVVAHPFEPDYRTRIFSRRSVKRSAESIWNFALVIANDGDRFFVLLLKKKRFLHLSRRQRIFATVHSRSWRSCVTCNNMKNILFFIHISLVSRSIDDSLHPPVCLAIS